MESIDLKGFAAFIKKKKKKEERICRKHSNIPHQTLEFLIQSIPLRAHTEKVSDTNSHKSIGKINEIKKMKRNKIPSALPKRNGEQI